MLDLIISYINFLILSISFLVKKLAFNPPNPPRYLIVKEDSNNEKQKEQILFLVKPEGSDQLEYKKLNPKYLNIEYYKIKNNNEYVPILILTPKYHFQFCIIYFQGNSGDLGTSLFECYEIAFRCNCIIITFEYPGYGVCFNDEINECEFHKRIIKVYNFVINVLNYKPNQIFLYGFSLGTGIAFDFACKKEFPVAGLILQSPFLSIFRTIYNVKKTRYFDLFNNCDKAKKLCRKTLFIHGNEDKIVPYIHGRILAKLVPKEYFYDFLTVNNADHNNLLKDNKQIVFKYINEFIADCNNNNESYNTNGNESNADISRKKIGDYNDIINSENHPLNISEDIRKYKKEHILDNTIKSSSHINFSLVNKITIDNEKSNIKNKVNEETKIKPNNEINYMNKSYNFKIKKNQNIENKRNISNIREKMINFSKNYYHVQIGTYGKDNRFALYRDYCKNKNNNNKELIKKKTIFENSLASIASSTNNISY